MKTDTTPKWSGDRTAFLNHPEHGPEFLETLNGLIATAIGRWSQDPNFSDDPWRRRKKWEEVSDTQEFQEAFDFVTDRLLSEDGFQKVMDRYNSKKDRTFSAWDYMTNRVRLVLKEWSSRRRDRPQARLIPVDPTETPPETAAEPGSSDAETGNPHAALSDAIDARLSPAEQAVLILRLWPLDVFPEPWRAKYLPVICGVSEANGLPPLETLQRLHAAMQQHERESDDELLKLQAKHLAHFEAHKHFDMCKREMFRRLRQSEQNDTIAAAELDTLLKSVCYVAVKKPSVAAVKAEFSNDEIYDLKPDRPPVMKNRPLWYRRRFSLCCYKQQYHRRVWLHSFRELTKKKPANGPMPHATIAHILNSPVGTCNALLSRARVKLQSFGNPDSDDCGGLLTTKQNEMSPEFIEQELQKERLQEHVCEDLKPRAG